ncbi:malate dehydrogenase (oxaloacetate-decarboxylating) [Proteiniborus ethanoligenes]|uniref:Malate dehydrogenase (Oxaloacetate-decarboxylating) n=1 Tax=Proteiniborus ethanoligenes TaxID=415015 RepID=A0A1H3LGU7_9FIRM|nr:NADP-dependent malic enzyme [Proteiniborus ethanoligenes]SDY63154.1 malate dehydrogenase (oxaloacetate-decarboxylating) [Proteiniborus ethanoligenes]
MKDYNKLSLEMHRNNKGKVSIQSKVKVENKDDLSIAYTPGVAQPCKEIANDQEKVYEYTFKSNTVAVVSDGTAVLGLGDIGPYGAIPVMEGKSILFKAYADVDAFPICLKTTDTEEIIRTVKLLEPVFGGINLEDIAAPKCFEIEKRLDEELDIPVFHDDQHGTAIVVLAGLINGLKLAEKEFKDLEVVINGSGAAGIAIAKLLLSVGVKDVILCDRKGAISKNRQDLNPIKKEMAEITNKASLDGELKDVIVGKNVFIGVSSADCLTKEMVKTMGEKSMIFAMANPIPEIMPDDAKEAGAFIVGTGRSDFANQINNVLAFPGIFRGALDVRASRITQNMKIQAAYGIANIVKEEELNVDMIIPSPFNKEVAIAVAEAVKKAAIDDGVARV